MNPSVRLFATVLGYAGLLPFLAATAAIFSSDPTVSGPGLYALTVYAAVFLSFMGAVHWGLAMRSDHAVARWQLAASVVPLLTAGLLVVVLPPPSTLIGLGVAFLVLLGFDLLAVRQGLAPDWYARLRVPLTVLSCVALWTAAWELSH